MRTALGQMIGGHGRGKTGNYSRECRHQRLDDPKREERGAKIPARAGGRGLKRWMAAHHLTLMTLPDTHNSIALGFSDRDVFRFHAALWSKKHYYQSLERGCLKANKIAAFISVYAARYHSSVLAGDFFLWEYRMECGVLHGRLPERPGFRHVALVDYMEWTTFLTVGRPLLVDRSFFLLCPQRS